MAVCGLLAGCSQTSAPVDTAEGAGSTAPAARPAAIARGQAHQAASDANACDTAIRAQANSAVLGSALGMVGSFGGFGGRGGMVAAQVASTAGGAIARSQQAQAQTSVMRECQAQYGS